MYQDIINFWFREIEPSQWWVKDDEFDQTITRKFSAVHDKATKGELFEWREHPRGRLAEIIVLDQFSRNMFRDTPKAFAYDQMALVLSQEAVSLKIDLKLEPKERSFLYLPFMHSESIVIHETAEAIYRQHEDPSSLKFELMHKQIIEKFGRYPHRNEILGRESTEEEIEFLKQPGSSF